MQARMLNFTPMLKFTPRFHPPNCTMEKHQTQFTSFPKIHMIANNKPSHISSCMMDSDANLVLKAAPLSMDVSNSILTDEELPLHVSAFEAICSLFKWVFSPAIKLVSPKRISFVVENDLIKFEHNGREVIGVVEHVVHHPKSMEVKLLCEHGLKNFKINDRHTVANLTIRNEENEKKWLIYTSVECKDDNEMKMVAEIKDILNATAELKSDSKYVMVDSMNPDPETKIIVFCYVQCSKSKDFEHYMNVRRKLFSEIDVIRCKHGSK